MDTWVALGCCDIDGCVEPAKWFTLKKYEVDRQLCNAHFQGAMMYEK